MSATIAAGAVKIFGVTLVGISTSTGVKLLFTLGLVLLVLVLRALALAVSRRILGGDVGDTRRFWARQGIQVIVAIVLVLGVVSIWVTPNSDVTTGVGLISAGLAFVLQQVITALAAYFVILRGDTFAHRALQDMRARYALSDASLEPSVFWRITDNWLELSPGFLVPHRGVRAIKDRMSRDILDGLDAAGIGIASATYDIVGMPALTVVPPSTHLSAAPGAASNGTVDA